MSTRNLIKESLFMLELSGLNPLKRNTKGMIKVALQIVVISYLAVEILMTCVYDWSGLNSMEDVTITIGILQGLIKYFVCIIHRHTITLTLDDMEGFWSPTKASFDLSKKIIKMHKVVRIIFTAFILTIISISSLFFLQPLLLHSTYTPYRTYHPRRSALIKYLLMYLLQLLVSFPGCAAILGFDSLFVSLIVNIVCELKILREKLRSVSCENRKDLKNLYELIEHHNLILGCIKRVSEVYSLYCLTVFLSNMLCICSSLLYIISEGFPLSLKAASKYGLIIMFYTMQLMFYGVAGTCIMTETELVSNAIFESNWWKNPPRQFKTAYILIIQRANKTEVLTAGGMFILSVTSVTKVLRMALSFFTMVQAVYSRQN